MSDDSSNDRPDGRPLPRDPDAVLSTVEAAFLTGLSRRTLEDWRVKGGGPPYIRLAANKVGYRRGSVTAWLERREHRSTSAEGAGL